MALQSHGNALPEGYHLHWYRIGRVLGRGGFGITYLAFDENLERQVAIKEYLPMELAVREHDSRVRPFTEDRKQTYLWGLERFLSEAQTLTRFVHPNVVRVLAAFRANDTAYMVMDHEAGRSLEDLFKFGHVDDEASLLRIVHPLLDGLEHVHGAGFIHRDVKPSNIHLRDDGSPVLLDFGSARMALESRTQSLTSVVSSGYSPFEQYHTEEGQQGPWTDIYGLGATLYSALDHGRVPVDAVTRGNALLQGRPDPLDAAAQIGRGRYSAQFLAAVDAALRFKPQDRPQTVAEWRPLFPPAGAAGDPREAPTQVSVPIGAPARTRGPRRHHTLMVVLAVVALLGGLMYSARHGDEPVPGSGDGIAERGPEEAPAPRPEASAPAGAEVEPDTQAALPLAAGVPPATAPPGPEVTVEAPAGAPVAPEEKAEPLPATEAPAGAAAGVAGGAAVGDTPEVPDADTRERVDRLLAQGEEALAALRLTTPPGRNAFEHFRAALELDPANAAAQLGLARIVERYTELAFTEAERGRYPSARDFLDRADTVLPDAEPTRRARERIAGMEAASQAASPPAASPAAAVQAVPTGSFHDTLRDGSAGPEMARIPAGRFAMGSPDAEAGRGPEEGPRREVTIARDFAIGRFEVTVAEFRRFVAATGHVTVAEQAGGCASGQGRREGATWREPGFRRSLSDRHPVVCVAWPDAAAYASWLGEQTGARYRLPSEAEWEYAARAGTTGARPWGDAPDAACRHANAGDQTRVTREGPVSGTPHPCSDGASGPAPVGRLEANAFGLHDMLGNVWEWTADCWQESLAGVAGDGTPAATAGCGQHVRRGGSFSSGIEELRSAVRKKGRPPAVGVGFRVARDL